MAVVNLAAATQSILNEANDGQMTAKCMSVQWSSVEACQP